MKSHMADYCDGFLQQVVGTPELADSFEHDLSGAYYAYDGQEQIDPYVRLTWGFKDLMSAVVEEYAASRTEDTSTQSSLHGNIDLGGLTTIRALEVVGQVYKRHAQAPQEPARIKENVGVALRHLLASAYQSRAEADRNLQAYFRGSDPHSGLGYTLRQLMNGYSDISVTRRAWRSFEVTEDTARQLRITPAHSILRSEIGAHCPAADSRLQMPAPGEAPSALLKLMTCISNVAIREVYPSIFNVAEESVPDVKTLA